MIEHNQIRFMKLKEIIYMIVLFTENLTILMSIFFWRCNQTKHNVWGNYRKHCGEFTAVHDFTADHVIKYEELDLH